MPATQTPPSTAPPRGKAPTSDRGFVADVKAMPEDLRAVPDDIREALAETNEKLEAKLEESPHMRSAMRVQLLLAALAIGFVVALALKLIGLPGLLAVAVFVIAAGAAWFVLIHAATPRDPTPEADPIKDA
jgi:hypothetical protein